MTILALRLASRVNAVSDLHAEKAKDIWADHPMVAITNGVHVPTWDRVKDSSTIWQAHQENKRKLLEVIAKKTGQQWNENDLLIGWARRMVSYKRPLALFADKARLASLLKNSDRPVRIVMAGSAHESDIEGARMLEELQRMIVTEFDGYVVYVPNYNIKLGEIMTAGTDVWLNTPVLGFEACGTSGMKACLNGSLPCSTKDGWVHEVNLFGIGWVLDSEAITDSLLHTIKDQIVPMYYDKNHQGMPANWVENMKHARELILNEYSATGMLREYIERMYLPAVLQLQTT
jgi:starch phosphorylase